MGQPLWHLWQNPSEEIAAQVFYDTYAGMVLPGAASAFTIFLLRQFFLSIPREIEEAALVEGCSAWGVLQHVTLPLSRPILVVVMLGSVQGSFESFIWPLIVTRTDSIRPVAVAIAMLSSGWGVSNPVVLQAALVMMVLPVVVIALFAQQHIVKGFARALVIG
ncbi:MAG: carbohydrate ABC transporter permease [Chloroflexi bacterium]|nr:carbohydrate ABC transporter permease [Chloroflexota bacterium]